MTDLSKHPILMQAHALIQEIEKCGCSEQITKAVTDAGALMTAIDEMIDAYTRELQRSQEACNDYLREWESACEREQARWSGVDREMVARVMAGSGMPSPGPWRDGLVARALSLPFNPEAPIYLRAFPYSTDEGFAAEALRVWIANAPAQTRREVEILMWDPMYMGRRVTLKQAPNSGTLASHLASSAVADTTPDAATRAILEWQHTHAAP